MVPSGEVTVRPGVVKVAPPFFRIDIYTPYSGLDVLRDRPADESDYKLAVLKRRIPFVKTSASPQLSMVKYARDSIYRYLWMPETENVFYSTEINKEEKLTLIRMLGVKSLFMRRLHPRRLYDE